MNLREYAKSNRSVSVEEKPETVSLVDLKSDNNRLKTQQERLNHYAPEVKSNVLKAVNDGYSQKSILMMLCEGFSKITGEESFSHQVNVIMAAMYGTDEETDEEKIERLEQQVKTLENYKVKSTVDLKIIQNAVKSHNEEIKRLQEKE